MSKILYRDGREEYQANEPIVVEDSIELKKDYAVRLIKDTGFHKECIAEERFEKFPSEKQIVWCLMKHKEASFASVSERYKLDSQELPFL